MSNRTLVASPGKAICGKCTRPVQMVKVDGVPIAVDPEVMSFVPSGRFGEVLGASTTTTGRRVHAEMCTSYQLESQRKLDAELEEKRKARLRDELADYNRRNPRRTKGL